MNADTRTNSESCSEIPYATEQGIFAKEQRICTREQGIWTNYNRYPDDAFTRDRRLPRLYRRISLHNWSAMESVMDLSELEFAGTIWELINRGRVAPLIAYIRSDKALRPEDRGYLADYLEGKLKRKRGRPIGGLESQKIKFLAGLVRAAKAQLRERGERYRIHNKTIDLVLDVYSVSGKPPVDREKLENYLRRSQRKPRKK